MRYIICRIRIYKTMQLGKARIKKKQGKERQKYFENTALFLMLEESQQSMERENLKCWYYFQFSCSGFHRHVQDDKRAGISKKKSCPSLPYFCTYFGYTNKIIQRNGLALLTIIFLSHIILFLFVQNKSQQLGDSKLFCGLLCQRKIAFDNNKKI